jgi:uncharacterized protein (TIGR03437 family)
MHSARFDLAIFLACFWACAAIGNAQTPTQLSLSFTGSGSGNANAFSLSGSGNLTPFGAATVSISGGGGAHALTVNFTFTLTDGSTLTSSGPATFGKDIISGSANVSGGTGLFANSTGTFSYSITAPAGTTAANVQFTLTGSGTVTATPASCQLEASPTMLAFSAFAGGAAAPPQSIALVSGCATTAKFFVTVDGGSVGAPAPGWIGVTPLNGVTPGALTVTANPGSMSAGGYPATIHVTLSGSVGQPSINIPVTFAISAASPQLQVSPGILRFSAMQQSPGNLTASLAVTSAGGGGPLAFSTTVVGGSPWISSVSPGSGQATANSPALVQVVVNASGLAAGSYLDAIQVSSAAGNVTVPVSLFVAENGPALALNVIGVTLNAIQGGGFSNAQTIEILNTGALSSTVNWSASLATQASWLSLVSSSGTATASTPGSLMVTLTPTATQMSPGGYYALVKISDPNSRNSPQYVEVVLNLESDATPPLPDPIPAGLFFVAVAGGGATSAQEMDINTSSATPVPFQVAASTSAGGAWLIVTPSSGTSTGANPGTVNISVNPAGLSTGVYTGDVNVSMSGALRSANVTLIVLPAGDTVGSSLRSARPEAVSCSPSKVVLTETGLVNNFAIPAGWPATLIAQLNDDCGNTLTGGSVVASFSNGDAPLTLAGNGQNGAYSATWQPGNSTSEMVVTLNGTSGALQPASVQLNGGIAPNLNQPPVLYANGTGNNLNPVVGAPLAPGTIASVYGSGLGPATGVSTGMIPVVTTFDNTYVLVGPYQAPLYYLSDGQLDIQLPAELDATQQYPIVVSVNGAVTLPDTLNIVPATPAVAALPNGGIIAQHADYSLVSTTSPAMPGEVVIIYLVGLGATNPSVPSGMAAPSTPPLAQVTLPVTVTVDGQNAVVDFAGLTPASVGLYQIDFQVPTNAQGGNLNVVVSQNGLVSNTTTLPVSQ